MLHGTVGGLLLDELHIPLLSDIRYRLIQAQKNFYILLGSPSPHPSPPVGGEGRVRGQLSKD
jgi:hypothetical protein